MARSLNRAQLIGNLTRDPELRYTPTGTAVCSFGIATNRTWTTDAGEKRDEADFHRIVAWNKLAELCSQFLTKGKKVYVEGRLTTRNWNAQDGSQRTTTEIIISDMILLDSSGRRTEVSEVEEKGVEETQVPAKKVSKKEEKPAKKSQDERNKEVEEVRSEESKQPAPTKTAGRQDEEVAPDDIPF